MVALVKFGQSQASSQQVWQRECSIAPTTTTLPSCRLSQYPVTPVTTRAGAYARQIQMSDGFAIDPNG